MANTYAVTFDNAKLAGLTVTVNWKDLSEASRDHYITFGIRQCLSDAVAGMSVEKGDTPESMRAAVLAKADRIASGEFNAGGRVSDPIAREMRSLAVLEVAAQVKKSKGAFIASAAKHGFDWNDDKAQAKFLSRVVASHVEKHDERLRAAATKIVAERRAAAIPVEVDLNNIAA